MITAPSGRSSQRVLCLLREDANAVVHFDRGFLERDVLYG